MWDPQVPALAERFRVVRYDTRGHGALAGARRRATRSTSSARDLLGLLDQLGIERASVAGVSLGGMAAMWLAAHGARARRPARAVLHRRRGSARPSCGTSAPRTVRAGGMAAIADAHARRAGSRPPPTPTTVRPLRRDAARACPPRATRRAARRSATWTCASGSPAIAAPTLVIAARDDPATPPEHADADRRRASPARGSPCRAAPRTSPNVERAEEVTAAMLEHLAP